MKATSFEQFNKHKSWPAWLALFIYFGFCALAIWAACDFYIRNPNPAPMIQVFIIFTTIMFVIFNYPQVLSIIVTLIGVFSKNKVFTKYDNIINTTIVSNNYKVAILYVTKDDFILNALKSAFNQNYKNCDIWVLDDSKKEEITAAIDATYKEYPGKFNILRRQGVGPRNKAGNINFFLSKHFEDYDFFGIMDADTYVSDNFISDGLKYFEYFNDVGIVQTTNNCIVNVTNNFQDVCAPSYSDNRLFWSLDGVVLNDYLITLCSGHSCIISKKALTAIGKQLSPMLSEDWSMMVDIRRKGFYTCYAGNIRSYEETPPNYVAWKKRMLRWETGAFDFSFTYFGKIMKSPYKFYEKIYIVFNATNSWVSPSFGILSNIFAFAMLYQVTSPLALPWITWVLSIIFLCFSAGAVCVKTAISKAKFSQTLKAFFFLGFLGAGIMPSLFVKSITLFFTKKKFAVTPKVNEKFKWYDTFKYNWIDIVFWMAFFTFIIATMAVTKMWYFAVNPFLWLSFASFISLFFFPTMSNKEYKDPIHCDSYKG